jgi:DnaD/phage-associated family protein
MMSNPLELRVLLHVFWRVWKTDRRPRCISVRELLADDDLVRSLTQISGVSDGREALLRGLELCAVRGTLLLFSSQGDGAEENQWVMVNTHRNRRWLRKVTRGEVSIPWEISRGATVVARRCDTLLEMYEKNIGMLTPLLAEELEEAAEEYSEDWVRQAISEAVGANKRSWKFVKLLLERWREQGRPGGSDRQAIAGSFDVDKYKRGKYSKFFGS